MSSKRGATAVSKREEGRGGADRGERRGKERGRGDGERERKRRRGRGERKRRGGGEVCSAQQFCYLFSDVASDVYLAKTIVQYKLKRQ